MPSGGIADILMSSFIDNSTDGMYGSQAGPYINACDNGGEAVQHKQTCIFRSRG